MSANNSSKGASRLASVLQARMAKVMNGASSVIAEKGEILAGGKLKLYSIPDAILDKDDYSVCYSIQKTRALKKGDQVLIVWTFDGEPIVIDKIVQADSV